MPQRVEFEALPSTRYDQYVFKLKNVVNFVVQPGGTKFKPFRDFLRQQGVWDKDRSEAMLSIVDLSWDKKAVKVGKLAKAIAAARSDADVQELLYARLKEENILLVKYVMEALDVESGGRLHSVHELYRMITSYVYPGAYITLVAFQAWMDWLAATGYIKLVGIRWALSDKGLKALVELKGMDVEEILEDMEEEGDDGDATDDDADDDADADDDDDAPAAARGKATAELDEDEDLFADLPPEPEPPSAADVAAARSQFEDKFDDFPGFDDAPPSPGRRGGRPSGVRAPAAAPAPAPMAASGGLHAPLSAALWAPVTAVSLEDADTAKIAARVAGWYQALGDWPTFTAARLGVEYDPAGGDLAILVELGVLASLIEGLPPQPQVFAFVKRLRQTTFFATLGHGEGLEDCLDALSSTGDEPWGRALFERVVHARYIARRVSMKIDLLMQLRAAASGREVVTLLREHLVGTHFVEAPFWVARELVRLGVLQDDAHKQAVAVPTPRLVANAARIGLMRVRDVYDFDTLLSLSEQVSKLFGAESGYGEALEVLDRGLGLSLYRGKRGDIAG